MPLLETWLFCNTSGPIIKIKICAWLLPYLDNVFFSKQRFWHKLPPNLILVLLWRVVYVTTSLIECLASVIRESSMQEVARSPFLWDHGLHNYVKPCLFVSHVWPKCWYSEDCSLLVWGSRARGVVWCSDSNYSELSQAGQCSAVTAHFFHWWWLRRDYGLQDWTGC